MQPEISTPRSTILRSARTRYARNVGVAFAIGLGLMVALMLGIVTVSAAPVAPSSTAHGDVIVQFSDHDLVARAITFTAPISGLRALELSGLEVITASTAYGPAVCSIGGVGCPATNCFCGGSSFWGYKSWDGSAWQDYMVGPADSSLNDGAVEGWRWGEWGSPTWPAQPVTAALQALDWLRPQQSLTDGGYGSDGGSAEALLTIGANGLTASEWRRQPTSPSLATYWLGRAPAFSHSSGAAAGKLSVGLIATETCWPHNTVRPSAYYSETSGIYAIGAGPQAWAILGTKAVSETVPAKAIEYLKGLAQSNGGWEWGPGWGTDTNSTALALQALLAVGEPKTSGIITQGLAYLRSAQNADGGFPYDPASPYGTASDANSTAYVIQGLRATGEDPTSAAWSKGANTPVSFLLSLQLPDGSFEWQKGNGANQLATQQAVPALLGRPFPLGAAQPEACPTLYLPIIHR